MINGVGIDIVDVDRVKERIERDLRFKEHVFHPEEISYCDSKPKAAEHYAVRFAVKEAFLKAVGVGLTHSHALHLIEVFHLENEKPALRLHGEMQLLQSRSGWKTIHVSLSHTKAAAAAIVILEA